LVREKETEKEPSNAGGRKLLHEDALPKYEEGSMAENT